MFVWSWFNFRQLPVLSKTSKFFQSSDNQPTNPSQNMSSHPAVRFNDPPASDYNSMDVDDSSMGRVSLGMFYSLIIPYLFTGYPLDELDGLYLGPEDDVEYASMSSGPPDELAALPGMFIRSLSSGITLHANFNLKDQSHPGQADDAGFLIDPDLYLGPEDDVIDIDELPDSADPPSLPPATPAASDVSISGVSIHPRPSLILILSPKPNRHLPNLVQRSRIWI